MSVWKPPKGAILVKKPVTVEEQYIESPTGETRRSVRWTPPKDAILVPRPEPKMEAVPDSVVAAEGIQLDTLTPRAMKVAKYLGDMAGRIVLSSTKRSEEKNKEVGGHPASFHISGDAFDALPDKEVDAILTSEEVRKGVRALGYEIIDERDKPGAAHWHLEPAGELLMDNGLTEEEDKQRSLAQLAQQKYSPSQTFLKLQEEKIKSRELKDVDKADEKSLLMAGIRKDAAELAKKGGKPVTKEEEKSLRYGLGIDQKPMTALERAGSIAGSFNKPVVEMVSSIPKMGAIVRRQIDVLSGVEPKPVQAYDMYKLGKAIDDKFLEWGLTYVDPRNAGFFTQDVPSGFGSVVAIAMSGSGAKGTATIAAKGGAKQAVVEGVKAITSPRMIAGARMMATQEFEAAKAAGATDEQALEVYLKNLPIGATEAIPMERAFTRIAKFTGSIGQVASAATVGALEEATQEGLQAWLTNQVAAGTYDPNRVPWQDLISSMGAGAFIGFFIPMIASAGRVLSPSQKQATQKAIYEALKAEAMKGGPTKQAAEALEAMKTAEPAPVTPAPSAPIEGPKIVAPAIKEVPLPKKTYLTGKVKISENPVSTDTDAEGNTISTFGTGLKKPDGSKVLIESITDPSGNTIFQSTDGAVQGATAVEVVTKLAALESAPVTEGDYVDYGGITGKLTRNEDGLLVVHTQDNEMIVVEGGLSGRPFAELGITHSAKPPEIPKEIVEDKPDIKSPIPDNEVSFVGEDGTVLIYGKKFKYDGVESDNKGNTTAIRVVDERGNTKYIRNQDAVYEIEIQKMIFETEPTDAEIKKAAAELKITKKNEPKTTEGGQIPEGVQQAGSVEDTATDQARKATVAKTGGKITEQVETVAPDGAKTKITKTVGKEGVKVKKTVAKEGQVKTVTETAPAGPVVVVPDAKVAFAKAVEFHYQLADAKATKKPAQVRELKKQRDNFLKDYPSVKYVYDNIKSITKQFEEKGILTKKGDCL